MKKYMLILLVLFGLLTSGMISNASALSINLSTPAVKYGEDTNMPDIEAIILSYMSPSTELYRATPGSPVSEEKSLAGSYQTTFSGDQESAQISYVGGAYVGPVAYLLAKDGSAKDDNPNTHAWYLFNLTALGWNGTDTIDISGLWPAQGSFSHISLYGATSTQVPEPASLILLGLGLLGLVGFSRRRK